MKTNTINITTSGIDYELEVGESKKHGLVLQLTDDAVNLIATHLGFKRNKPAQVAAAIEESEVTTLENESIAVLDDLLAAKLITKHVVNAINKALEAEDEEDEDEESADEDEDEDEDEVEEVAPKKRGRPTKTQPVAKRGRPAKTVVEAPKKRGRPAKAATLAPIDRGGKANKMRFMKEVHALLLKHFPE